MPELPEVETITRQLQEHITGKTIIDVTVRKEKLFIGNAQELIGTVITGVTRRAKMIVISLSSGKVLCIHLKMTGQVLVGIADHLLGVTFVQSIPFAGTRLPGKTTHIILTLSDHRLLFFNDNRQFGWMKLLSREDWNTITDNLGPEPLEAAFTPPLLQQILLSSRRPIKVVLMDPAKIAGIGNIYANESLWRAGIYPGLPAAVVGKTMPQNITRLHQAIRDVLLLAIANQGSSSQDEAFVNALGEKGAMQHHFAVYHRTGAPCLVCQTPIASIRLAGRGTFYCPVCQKETRPSGMPVARRTKKANVFPD